MSTTLPLFWNLSSASKEERVESSAKLIGALERFQVQFVSKREEKEGEGNSGDAGGEVELGGNHSKGDADEDSDGEDDEAEDDAEGDADAQQQQEGEGYSEGKKKTDDIDALNAPDVSYSIRRLVRGLASTRESSRLGFAVALTELLSRLTTITTTQIITLILSSSKPQGHATGAEIRSLLFARLFGLTAIIQSGLLVRQGTVPASSSTSSALSASSLDSLKEVVTLLLDLAEKRSWLRESSWWTLILCIDHLASSTVPWKSAAFAFLLDKIYVEDNVWTPEKVGVTIKLQCLSMSPSLVLGREWKSIVSPVMKEGGLLSSGNLQVLGRILKESTADSDEELKTAGGSWKPQIHFVWDMIIDSLVGEKTPESYSRCSFPEFFRVVVDDSLFSSTSSPHRKYWGFQIFQKCLSRVSERDLPMLFTRNFMRCWINHLSHPDRYLHRVALQVAHHIQTHVQANPSLGLTLILQLTGINGHRQFDRLTRTKTVEGILASMDVGGVEEYVGYLVGLVDEGRDGDGHGDKRGVADEAGLGDVDMDKPDDFSIDSRRTWIADQLSALIRNGAIPKTDAWVTSVLDWFVVHGLFGIRKVSKRSVYTALRTMPTPPLSEDFRAYCRMRLLGSLAELTSQITLIKKDDKTTKLPATASDGQFWLTKVCESIEHLRTDAKHVSLVGEADDAILDLREKVWRSVQRFKSREDSNKQGESRKGIELLLSAVLVYMYVSDTDVLDLDVVESCISATERMFPEDKEKGKAKDKKKPKKQKQPPANEATNAESSESEPEGIDILVDTLIGFLEKSTAYMRAVANQVFSFLSEEAKESTIELILSQLERRDPAELVDEEIEVDGEDDDEDSEDNDDEEENDDDDDKEEEEDENKGDVDDAAALELRQKLEEALRQSGIEAPADASDSDDEMDDDQMMAIDERLADVFRARVGAKGGKDVDAQREATHFKNRVLDLIDIFIKKQPTSPLVIRLILPLVDLITSSGSDERQLSDKATGLLKSRLAKSKDLPLTADTDQVTSTLNEIHARARKAHTSDTLATLSQCSLYLAKIVIHVSKEDTVLEVYRESLEDFATRKASRLNYNFFQDFIRHFAGMGWKLREDVLLLTNKAANIYRKCQMFQLLQPIVNQISSNNNQQEIMTFMTHLRQVLLDAIFTTCDEQTFLNASQVKDFLKLALLSVRQTKRLLSDENKITTIWEPSEWDSLKEKLAKSDRFKNSSALSTMCRQMSQMSRPSASREDEPRLAKSTKAKRKEVGGGEGGADEAVSKKKKRTKIASS